ncbi:class I adenylate-forming enzyme family protein [Kistimonas asteriae]|uniref:class I adenylate-forming enzyme family protein n=1 Tax=Kistimonas asteriae TaxID=517724 RepID=UPI001BA8582D|nr:class I adenylate-forming enzyme family protein [Kistimonas asteriae]
MQAFRREYIAFNERHGMWGEEESLDTLFRRTVAIHPERIALVDSGAQPGSGSPVRYSYRQLADAVTRVSAALFQAGVRQHRVVLIQMTSVADAIILKLAIARLGAIACTIPEGFTRTEWRLLLAAIGPDVIALVHGGDAVGESQKKCWPDLPEHCLQFSFSVDASTTDVIPLDSRSEYEKTQLIQLGEYLGSIHLSPDDYFTLYPSMESLDGVEARLRIVPGSHSHWQGVASFISEKAGMKNGDVLVCPYICQEPLVTGVFLYNWLSSGARLVLTGAENAKEYFSCLMSEQATFSLITVTLANQLEEKNGFFVSGDLGYLRSMVVLPEDCEETRVESLVSQRGLVPIPLRATQGTLSIVG